MPNVSDTHPSLMVIRHLELGKAQIGASYMKSGTQPSFSKEG
jgi:hypothetical protein